MTLMLSNSVEVKTHPAFLSRDVRFGEHEVPMRDFLAAAFYVLTNTDLEEGDPRIAFVDSVKKMKVGEGHNQGCQRLILPGTHPLVAPF